MTREALHPKSPLGLLTEVVLIGVSVFLALLLQRARGLPAVAGMVCGTGFWGLALLAQANAHCAISYSGCVAPNVIAPVVIAAALLTAGAALTLTVYLRTRRTAATV